MPNLNQPQGRFMMMDTKFRAYVAGFGSGKTWVGSTGLVCHHAKFPNVDSAYYAPTYKLVKGVFYPTIDEVAYNAGFDCRIKVSDHEVHLSRGRKHYGVIHCRTMDNPENIVGFKSGHALVDELDIMTTEKAEQAWRKILARMRYKVDGLKNGVDVTTTPEGFKFTHDRFVKRGGAQYGLIQASTYDNEMNLPDDYIETLKEDYPPQLIEAYLNGQFVNLTSGTVYQNYDREAHRSNEMIRKDEPLFVGMDFNVTKMAATIYVKREGGREWHAVDEIVDGYDTPEMIRILTERFDGHHITVYPDASGKNRKSVGASTSDIAMLEANFSVRAHKSNPMVKDRILSVNSAFNKGVLRVNDRNCPTVADNLEQQVYDKNGEPDKKSNKDHQNDATGYPIAFEMPINKPVINTNIRMAF
jgi:Terminase large subunit, T4likevirus-type, N-terminal/Terminase RNaseH-like domain